MRRLFSVAPVLLWLITPLAFAQLPGITSQPLPGGGQSWSLPVQTLVFITSLTFIPAILLMMTSFTRIIIVFGLLRNALGTPSAPPNLFHLTSGEYVLRPPQPASDSRLAESHKTPHHRPARQRPAHVRNC